MGMTYEEYLVNRRPYQAEGVQFLLEQKHCCLYYKPGKGKTYPCIEAVRDIDKSKGGMARVLILSTADAIKNMWYTEIYDQHIMPKNTVYVTTMKAVQDSMRKELLAIPWDVIIVDECHKIKAHNTKIAKLVFLLTKKCEYVFGLSGTPRGNSDVDIFCQFHNMHIGDWGSISYTAFVENCCICNVQFFGGKRITTPTGINDQYRAAWESNIQMYTRRIDYDEDDNMPELIIDTQILEYKPTKTYLEAEQGIIQLSDYETTLTKLAAISKAHQIANGFIYVDEDGHNVAKPVDGRNEIKAIFLHNYITCKIPQLKKIVVVYKFKYDLQVLKADLADLGYTEDVNKFKTDNSRILLLQCSHSESINLQVADAILFYTMDYSFINYDQMIHRAWRMGRDKPVYVTVFIVDKTVEKTIWRVIKSKGQLADLFYAIKGETNGPDV